MDSLLISSREVRTNKVLRDLFDESTLPFSSVRRKAEIKRRARAIARYTRSQAKKEADAAFLRKRRRYNERQMERLRRPLVATGLDGEPIVYTRLQMYLAERNARTIDTNGWSDLVRRYGKENVISLEDWKKFGFFDFYNPKEHIITRINNKGSWQIPNLVLKERPPLHVNNKRLAPKTIQLAKVVFRAEA